MFKRLFLFLLSLAVFLGGFTYAFGYNKEIEISAASSCVMDGGTNTVLYEKNSYKELPIASTTKVMTSILALESGRLEREITVTNEMLSGTEGTMLYLKPGDRITLLDLVKGALIVSGNDAANVIAFAVSGSIESFSVLMNKKAKTLGMNNTNFVTPSGLDSNGHYSCAYDMALLSSYAMKNEAFSSIVKRENDSIKINGKEQLVVNHNKLLSRSKYFNGIKTGFTKKAGRCLLSAYNYKGATVIIVTLNDRDDWDDHIRLVNSVKNRYTLKDDSGELEINTVGGKSVSTRCYYEYSLYSVSDVYVKLYYYPFIYFPYKSGDTVGYAVIYTNGNELKRVDIKIL